MTPATLRRSERTDQIIRAAGKLFASQGYHGTTTLQIAQNAAVSENTLFRHFDNKEDLFWTALRFHLTELKSQFAFLDEIEMCESSEASFPKMLELFSEAASCHPEFLRMTAIAFLDMGHKVDAFGQEHLSPLLASICRYLETNIKAGKLRDVDPVMAITGLVTTALISQGVLRLIGSDKPVFADHRIVSSAYMRFWLEALAPPVAKSA
jgi:AcrR family transcriptional regulator